eukprot:scaffold6813_cov123-Isochrysis_galbana.AAC.14
MEKKTRTSAHRGSHSTTPAAIPAGCNNHTASRPPLRLGEASHTPYVCAGGDARLALRSQMDGRDGPFPWRFCLLACSSQ